MKTTLCFSIVHPSGETYRFSLSLLNEILSILNFEQHSIGLAVVRGALVVVVMVVVVRLVVVVRRVVVVRLVVVVRRVVVVRLKSEGLKF